MIPGHLLNQRITLVIDYQIWKIVNLIKIVNWSEKKLQEIKREWEISVIFTNAAQLFPYFFGIRNFAEKVLLKCWWNYQSEKEVGKTQTSGLSEIEKKRKEK